MRNFIKNLIVCILGLWYCDLFVIYDLEFVFSK